MNHDSYDDRYLARILRESSTIALLGASPRPDRPSHGVMRFLLARGYTVYPVNPGQTGKEILGQRVFARLADISGPIDMVDVFRAPQYLMDIVTQSLALPQRPRVIWTQLGVRDDLAAAAAEEGGIDVVMDRCPAIEYPRLVNQGE